MRIRQVRREFWTDRRIALLPKSTRLFYIGLWAVADDAGYLPWDIPQIAGELFPFDSMKRRERECEADAGRLVAEARVVVLECGRHALIPTLQEHQKHAGGERLETVKKEHEKDCSGGLRSTTEHSDMSTSKDYDRNVTVGKGKERGGTGGSAGAPNGAARSLPIVETAPGVYALVDKAS